MRTTFTSIVFVFSLSQLAIVVSATGRQPRPGCGTTFRCYAPEICTEPSLAGRKWEDGSVKQVDAKTEVTDDCPAIIYFHQYGLHWAYVSIESLQATSKIKSIVFKKTNNAGVPKAVFTCSINEVADKVEGKYSKDGVNDLKRKTENPTPSNLKCTFEVKLLVREKIFGSVQNNDKIVFKIDTVDTKYFSLMGQTPIDFPRCDPDSFQYTGDFKKDKLYSEVKYELGKLYCGSYYKAEFRTDKSSEYQLVGDDFECFGSQFKINGVEIMENVLIYIRCVAEAKYFCDYPVKTESGAGKIEPKRTIPEVKDDGTLIASEMQCPTESRHLFINKGTAEMEKKTFIKDAKFECVNYGGTQIWTVGNEMITKTAPTVYCTKEIPCNLENKIPVKNVKNGDLQNGLPKCYGAKLTVNDENVNETLTRCDTESGKYKYTIVKKNGEVEEKIVEKDTIFVCKYEKVDVTDVAQNQQNRNTIVIGSSVAGGVAAVLIIAGVIAATAFLKYRVKKMREIEKMKRIRENENAWLKYCAVGKEKAALTKKKEENQEKSASAEPCNWNSMQMFHQYIAAANFFDSNGESREKNENDCVLFPITDPNQAECIVRLKNSNYPMIDLLESTFCDLMLGALAELPEYENNDEECALAQQSAERYNKMAQEMKKKKQ